MKPLIRLTLSIKGHKNQIKLMLKRVTFGFKLTLMVLAILCSIPIVSGRKLTSRAIKTQRQPQKMPRKPQISCLAIFTKQPNLVVLNTMTVTYGTKMLLLLVMVRLSTMFTSGIFLARSGYSLLIIMLTITMLLVLPQLTLMTVTFGLIPMAL